VLDGVSVEFAPVKSMRTAAGVVRRVRAHLDSIALCRSPAFKSAKVLALREEIMIDDSLLPVQPDPDVLARLERLGLELPERYQKIDEEESLDAHGDEPLSQPGS
jgi:hypothetical protein